LVGTLHGKFRLENSEEYGKVSEIPGSHCGDYKDDKTTGISVVQSRWSWPTFQTPSLSWCWR